MIIGGYQDGKTSNKTWIIEPTKDFEVIEGPRMNYARTCHSSATMNIGSIALLSHNTLK